VKPLTKWLLWLGVIYGGALLIVVAIAVWRTVFGA
jgi:hypothetical protein